MNKIAVFRASGKTGKLFTELALNKGYQVKALVRDPSRLTIQKSNLEVIKGDTSDAIKVEETIKATEAVINLIGPGKGSSPELQRTSTTNILRAMEQNNVKRLILLASLPVGILDPKDKPALMNKFMMFIAKNLIGTMVQDARAHIDLIKQSEMDWTVVRSPVLNDQPSQGKYRVGYLDSNTGKGNSRSDVAAFMLDVLMNDKYIGQMPLISN